jgi:hypothetical protein
MLKMSVCIGLLLIATTVSAQYYSDPMVDFLYRMQMQQQMQNQYYESQRQNQILQDMRDHQEREDFYRMRENNERLLRPYR